MTSGEGRMDDEPVITTRRLGEWSVVTVTGELDMQSGPALEQVLHTLIDGGEVRLVLDLAEVSFIDSAGLGVFVRAAKLAAPQEGTVRLARCRDRLLEILRVTALDGRFPGYPTVEAAMADPTVP